MKKISIRRPKFNIQLEIRNSAKAKIQYFNKNSNSNENAIFKGNLSLFNIHKFNHPEFNVQW